MRPNALLRAPQSRIVAPRVASGGGCGCPAKPRPMARRNPMTREVAQIVPHRPPDIEPIVIGTSKRTQCRPFIKIEKDAEKFAACNALANEIGPLNTPKKTFRLLADAIGDELNEVFGILTLDLHLRLKGMTETGRGEASSVMAPMIPTLQAAVVDAAHAVILFHVHPSGIEAEPSQADIDTTQSFADAFETIGVILLDHVIVAGDIRNRSYYSFLEDNAL